jgi:hypothetical protein
LGCAHFGAAGTWPIALAADINSAGAAQGGSCLADVHIHYEHARSRLLTIGFRIQKMAARDERSRDLQRLGGRGSAIATNLTATTDPPGQRQTGLAGGH